MNAGDQAADSSNVGYQLRRRRDASHRSEPYGDRGYRDPLDQLADRPPLRAAVIVDTGASTVWLRTWRQIAAELLGLLGMTLPVWSQADRGYPVNRCHLPDLVEAADLLEVRLSVRTG